MVKKNKARPSQIVIESAARPLDEFDDHTGYEPGKPALIAVRSSDGHPFWERHEAHPGGEVWVAGDAVVQVAQTAAVQRALKDGRLALAE